APDQVTVTGETRLHHTPAASGNIAIRNFCAVCNSLVFGGDQHGMHIYAGSLDEPSGFKPTIAVFTRDRPEWAPIPAGLRVFERMPPGRQSGSS
ncbi:MAG TPA: GFA family protein, partial [Rhizorhapis sp.]|nr:GFA family protein [Rhizorhapis sp.]